VKEAMGGVFTMQAILVFLVLATGLLAFSVSYTKSFRVKNEIRRIIEQYEGLTESYQWYQKHKEEVMKRPYAEFIDKHFH